MSKIFKTNFDVAAHWLHTNLILCNEICRIDESIWGNMLPVIGFDGKPKAPGHCAECGGRHLIRSEDDESLFTCPECGAEVYANEYNSEEIYQWFLTDCGEDDVEFLRLHFGLLFTYSDKLDLWVLCVTHFGTMWRGVDWETDLEQAEYIEKS